LPEERTPFPAHFEIHRAGIGLVPQVPAEASEPAHTAIFIENVPGSSRPLRSCTCPTSKRKTCSHLKALAEGAKELTRRYPGGSWERVFAATAWFRLARILFEGAAVSMAGIGVARLGEGLRSPLRITTEKGEEIARYLDISPARLRLLERLGKAPAITGAFDRAALLERLALFQTTPEQRELNRLGGRTRRQEWEESFWYRLAYHCVREAGPRAGHFQPAVNLGDGRFTLTFHGAGDIPLVEVTVPRQRVAAALRCLAEAFPDQEGLTIAPIPLQSLFRVTESTELDLVEIRPGFASLQEGGEALFFEQEDFEQFRYGNLVFVRELGVLAELERESRPRKFRSPARMRLARGQVPAFLDEHREDLARGTLVLDEAVAGLKIFREFDTLTLSTAAAPGTDALERSWYWISGRYRVGSEAISLAHLLQARRDGLPYYETAAGWIDLAAPAFQHLDDLLQRLSVEGDENEGETGGKARSEALLRLSASDLLRLGKGVERPLAVAGERGYREVLERLLSLTPEGSYRPPAGLTSALRPYQERGVEWLHFLVEHGLGGLLADDMGLGKTHQAMALMLGLAERRGAPGGEEGEEGEERKEGEKAAVGRLFLVVAPTSVLPHWQRKLGEHAPTLPLSVYYGPERDPARDLAPVSAGEPARVILTSYGLLRRDAAELAARVWDVVIFDEIQNLKNPGTQSYQAAVSLPARVKLGLTGTPIENSLGELKALFDLVLPGYLGGSAEFEERYGHALAAGEGDDDGTLTRLRRLVSPFVLRRLKGMVLAELPEKFEDVRTCALSEEQVRLYRDLVETRGRELAGRIEAGAEPVPYIHVFAVLNLLKQICDHPALALGEPERADEYRSGKWELFVEILAEALGSGLKVVVFSQYLGMIRMMESHLSRQKIGFATLTGASRGRGALVDRFNTDPECQVFLASLKAGGTGIDLVGGSVVIHYDRWWNAAREDQATDRVHRIGQKRAVQVVKLITEGTLEEKIDALIDAKRRLAERVIEADDPHLAKLFSREQLLELLALPSGSAIG